MAPDVPQPPNLFVVGKPARGGAPRCSLCEMAKEGKPRIHRLAATGAGIAPDGRLRLVSQAENRDHDWIRYVDDGWKLVSRAGSELRVNGVSRTGVHALSPGDHLTIGSSRFIFYPLIDTAVPPEANGFDRARRHILCALEIDGELGRDLLKGFADLETSIDGAERMAVVQPAIALMNKELWQDALAALDRAAVTAPRHANLQLHRAICFAMLDRADDAFTAAVAAKDFADDDKTRAEAEQWLAQLPDLMVQSAIRKLNDGKTAAAKSILVAAESRWPRHFGVLYHLAICQLQSNELATASDLLRRAERNAEDNEERQAVGTLRSQIEQAQRHAEMARSVDQAMELMNDASDPRGVKKAVDMLERLPREALERDDIKLVYLAAQARCVQRGLGFETRGNVENDLRALMEATDNSDIRDSARTLLEQLGTGGRR